MKKLFLIYLALTSINAFAGTTVISSHLKNTLISWELNNHLLFHEVRNQLDEDLFMRVIVNKYVEFKGKYHIADTVRFTCNDVAIVLKPGMWTHCAVHSGKSAYVVYNEYVHGAQGAFDVNFDYE